MFLFTRVVILNMAIIYWIMYCTYSGEPFPEIENPIRLASFLDGDVAPITSMALLTASTPEELDPPMDWEIIPGNLAPLLCIPSADESSDPSIEGNTTTL